MGCRQRVRPRVFAIVLSCAALAITATARGGYVLDDFPVPAGSRPHDVAPALDGGIWYTAQDGGALGWLDPDTGQTHHIPLGAGSRPHGVIVGPDGAPWITDGGRNAIIRVDPNTEQVTPYPLPANRPNANLNTATFDNNGVLWFTGQNGVYGRLSPASGQMTVYDAPRGRGPYGITTTPSGDVYYASLAGNYVGRINTTTGAATVLEPPTTNQGARRVWSDSLGQIWVSEWNAGQVARYNPANGQWREWPLPGPDPSAYAVFVDDEDIVWLSDFGGNALVRFDPVSEQFTPFPLPSNPSNVRQILGRPGEVWGAESAADQLVVIRFVSDELPGDYSRDGSVDAADYVVWRKTGIDGPTGYGTWRTHFGEPGGIGSGASVYATIPEPATLVLLILAAAGWCIRRRHVASSVP
jgi:virginiamycin B lyase